MCLEIDTFNISTTYPKFQWVNDGIQMALINIISYTTGREYRRE